jgi:hypothetical protein
MTTSAVLRLILKLFLVLDKLRADELSFTEPQDNFLSSA